MSSSSSRSSSSSVSDFIVGSADEDAVKPLSPYEWSAQGNTKRSRLRMRVNDESSSDSSEEEDWVSEEGLDKESSDDDALHESPAPKLNMSTSHKCSNATTARDAITHARLETRHVCWSSPDDSVELCFNIETLLRIAKVGGKGVWMQPPHFRTEMEIALRKQIAHKFGDAMLDAPSREGMTEDEQISSLLSRFAYSRLMDSPDLYVCPVCYEVAKSWFYERDAEEGADDVVELDSPVDILKSVGLVASRSFCFFEKHTLLRHLKRDHMIQSTKQVSNDLYAAYKMRETDGLLQRWIATSNDETFTTPIRYWSVYACDYLALVEMCRTTPQNGSAEFPDESSSNRVWTKISAPFAKNATAYDDDFIADDDDDDAPSGPVFIDDDDEDDEAELAAHLESLKEQASKLYASEEESEEEDPRARPRQSTLSLIPTGRGSFKRKNAIVRLA